LRKANIEIASPETYVIRLATAHDLESLPAIEVKAGSLFAQAGLQEIADHEPGDVEFLQAFLRAGAVHVVTDGNSTLVGFGLTGLLDGTGHLYELAVDPAHGRRGLGARLVEAGCGFARAKGCRAVTLSTFRDLAWNGPFYERLGFRFLDQSEWTPGMHILRMHEIDMGLPAERRGFMRKEL
jgi:ribosomal protein S18 acetylase RimI-like enzyme